MSFGKKRCLKILEEDLTEESCRSDLCRILNDTSVKVKMPFSLNTHSQGLPVLAFVEISDGDEETDFSGSSSTEENKTLEGIDEALQIGICNLSRLEDADKMLKCFELKVKQEGDKVAETADRKFDELVTSVLSRKKELCAELVESINNYSADVAKAKQLIEEKKKGLNGAVRIARELKITPSVRTYCDLAQVIHDLKLPVDAELSVVNSLKEKTSPSEGNGQNALSLGDKKEMPSYDTQISADNTILPPCGESKTKAWANKPGVHRAVKNVQVQESLAVVPHQNTPALPKSPSSPDIIIEEIFEDDLESSTELVFVSHVVNPCHFYIRRYSQKKEGVFLEEKLNNFCCSKSSYLLPSDVLELGVQIFIKSKETGMWCRGTITKLIPVKSKKEEKPSDPIRYKVCDVAVMEVFLIDVGSSEALIFSGYDAAEQPEPSPLQTIEPDDICLFVRKPDKNIEAELGAVPPLAVQCSLKDIVPKNASESWGEEAKTNFLGMVNNKVVLMTIFREENGVLIVDLKKPPHNKISSDMPVSLKDALVFLDLARFKSHLPNHLENNMVLRYKPPKIPEEKEVFVVVCHINSPSDFYLQLVDSLDTSAFPKKNKERHKHQDSKDLQIVCPVEGQPCIAKHEDGNWYRAQITGLPHSQEVVVKYVDFGSVANVTLKDICKAEDEILSFPEKAIKCRLAYIEPYKAADEWNREATRRFKEMTEDKFMVCSIVEVLKNNILSVKLFDSHAPHGRGSSINCQLVKENLASYIPGYVESNSVWPNEIWDVPVEETAENLKDLNPINMRPLEEERDFGSLAKKELQVRISHVVSPSKIFIQWLSSGSILKSLQEKMAAFYKESQPESVKWECNMHCAVYVHDLKQWQRGQISKIVSETTAEVMLYDSGAEKTVDISCLRKLEENMKRIKTLAIECSLVDISPTGGSMQWTATVCDCISYYLTGAQAKIIIQESDTACALPVKIFCKDEAGQLIDISEHLIKKGLAFRNNRTHKAAVACAVPKKHPEIRLEEENPQLNSCDSETACERDNAAEEKDGDVSESEQKPHKTYKSLVRLEMHEIYKAPIIPEAKIFQAVVSCVGHDGTIYMIPKSFESKLKELMSEIQSNFKCLGLLEPYCWKKGEACVIRGSDTLWYRGKVVELGGGTLQVQYIDRGYIEKVPPCHLYPTTLYTDTPPFCIPCQLYKTVPVGNFWQRDAVHILQKLLTNEEVEIHVQQLPDNPWGKLSVSLYFDGMSLSSFMAYQQFCVIKDCQDVPKQELLEGSIQVLPSYTLPPLPVPGDTFPVRVTHFVSPKEVYICLNPSESVTKLSTTEGDASCNLDSLSEALKWCNKNVDSLPLLTNFRTEMPCLVEYRDGLWYRAKLLSVEELNPDKILIQFVDYGNFSVVPTSKLRCIPHHLLQYPVQAVRALLAGFKPLLSDTNAKRIPYCPEWSVEALWAMMDCTEGKQLSASILASSPEVTISLYEDNQKLVHMKLIEMGLAELEE
ncbi:RING finger protein 17 [Mergus octosetaceus]